MSCTQFRSSLDKDDESKLGKVIKGVKSRSYEKWLCEEFDLVSSAKQKLRWNMSALHKYIWATQKSKAGKTKFV